MRTGTRPAAFFWLIDRTNMPDTPDPPAAYPDRGRLLGVDYGSKRVGLAISDVRQSLASPLIVIQRQGQLQELAAIKRITREHEVAGLVVGLPVHMSGDEGGKAAEARAYGTALSERLGLPVRYWDERFTSAAAEVAMRTADLSPKRRRQLIDKVAAQILLQAYLDAEDREAAPPALPARESNPPH